MTSVVRYSKVQGSDAALLTAALTDSGNELASQKVIRIFGTADIGANAGQTRDATDPTIGCLAAQFSGSRVQDIINLQLWRTVPATNQDFNRVVTGAAADTVNLGWRVDYNSKTGISSIYILDSAAAADGRIVAADWIEFDVLLGDIVS